MCSATRAGSDPKHGWLNPPRGISFHTAVMEDSAGGDRGVYFRYRRERIRDLMCLVPGVKYGVKQSIAANASYS